MTLEEERDMLMQERAYGDLSLQGQIRLLRVLSEIKGAASVSEAEAYRKAHGHYHYIEDRYTW